MWDIIVLFFHNIAMSFYNFGYAVTHPELWLDWSNKQAITRFVYYGGSKEFLFVILTLFFVITAIGLWKNCVMWFCVRGLEGMANGIGRVVAWAGLLMVLQQIIIVFMQRIFTAAEISLAFGSSLTHDISWWAEELKLYNAMIVALCVTYTFVQGGHVRVDLVYAKVGYRTKKTIDMLGALVFMLPTAVLVWFYGWFYLWRHLIVPKPSASDSLEKLMAKSNYLRWNVETIGFSPNGFNGYFIFKILLITYAALVFLHGIAFFYRSYLERKEGMEAEGKYLDRDSLGQGEEAYEGTH